MEIERSQSSVCNGQAARQSDMFSQLVRKIVIHERRGALKELAATLGLSYGAFYNRLNGRAEFNPREINMLLRELGDTRLVDCLLHDTGYRGMRSPTAPAARSDQDVVDIALSCAVETLSAVCATMAAIRRRGLDRDQGIQIENIIYQAQQELASLQAALLDITQMVALPARMDRVPS